MDMIETSGFSKNIFDALAIFLAVNIIFWFTWASYYNVKIILLYKKRKEKVFFLTTFNLILSLCFVGVFWYIIICTPIKGSLIDNSSFGALIIRPLILMEAVGTAMNQLEKYRRERNKDANII